MKPGLAARLASADKQGPADLATATGAMLVWPPWIGQIDESSFNPDNPALNASKISAGGRQAAWRVHVGAADADPAGHTQGLLRHYRRGGLVARVLKHRYFWLGARRTRAFAEARLLNWMHACGLPVPRAMAAAYWCGAGIVPSPFYRAAILVEYLPDTVPLAVCLQHPHAVAQAIFAMHEAGVWHADLNAFNILLDSKGKVWLIDFDRACRYDGPLSAARRRANLHRLRRSLIKVAGTQGAAFWDAVMQGYPR